MSPATSELTIAITPENGRSKCHEFYFLFSASMTKRIIQTTFWTVCSLALFLLGCSKDPGPPPPLAVEQIPAELDKAFKLAKQETKDLVAKVSSGLQAKDFPGAYDAVQGLCSL